MTASGSSGAGRAPIAIWFGSAERPLAGYLHAPAGECRGGAVICAPFGYEANCAYRSLRRIAERLAADGLLVLRFDYPGTGGSDGASEEPGRLARWQSGVAAAVAELRRRGVPRPGLVGLRLGGGLAAAALAGDGELGPVALWAPVTSGRRYYRELRGQVAITPGGVVGDGSFNVIGHRLLPDDLAELKAWRPLDGLSDVDADVLLVESAGWRDAEDARTELAATGARLEVLIEPGTSHVLERTAEEARVPRRVVDAIGGWFARRTADAPALTVDVAPGEPDRRLPGAGVDERLVTIGSGRLHGVLTTPSAEAASGVGVLFLNNGVAAASGPARAWTEFARALAGEGHTCLRFDMTGLGDSPDRSARPVDKERACAPWSASELIAAAQLLRAEGATKVVVVGLCSGAQVALRTLAYRGRVDAAFAINPPLYFLGEIGAGPPIRWLWRTTAFPMSKAKVRRLAHRLPVPAWALLDRLSLFPLPTTYLRRAARRGTRVHLVFGTVDKGYEDIQVRAREPFAELIDSGQIRVDLIEHMEHSMFDRAHRSAVFGWLRECCAEQAGERISAT